MSAGLQLIEAFMKQVIGQWEAPVTSLISLWGKCFMLWENRD